MNLSLYERETIISFNEAEKTAHIYTHNGRWMKKLDSLVEDRPDECKFLKSCRSGQAKEYEVPKAWLRVQASRILTEEQKEKQASMLAKLRVAERREKMSEVQPI